MCTDRTAKVRTQEKMYKHINADSVELLLCLASPLGRCISEIAEEKDGACFDYAASSATEMR